MRDVNDNLLKRWIWSGALAFVAILLAVGLGLFALHGAARDRLDEALGERLVSVARTSAHLVPGDSLLVWSYDPYESTEFIWLRSRLQQIRRENELSELTLCDADGFVLVSAVDRLEKGVLNAFWDVDPAAVEMARQGFPSASNLYRSGLDYQKSAHAPVTDSGGQIVGVLSVEAEADFFDALSSLRRGAIATALLVLVFLILMAIVLGRLLRSVMRYRASILRQENLAAMGRMTAGIAHEIRNPLGIIRGAGELQANRLKQAGIEMPTSGFIQEEVDRLDRILTRYLAFGRGGSGDREMLDLDALVRRVARNLKNEMSTTGVTIRVESSEGLPDLRGDSPGLQQVLLNLLFNARDEMPDGGEILMTIGRENETIVLRVHDQGAGLQGKSGEDLFEPFRTHKEKGSGLGLAVVRQVIEEHGGTVTLEDRPDAAGALVTVKLPIEGE